MTTATVTANIPELLQRLRSSFSSGRTRPLFWRRGQLHRLRELLIDHERRFLEALKEDLGKPRFEAYSGEIGYLTSDVNHTLKRLSKWTRVERVSTPLLNFKGSSRIQREPLGVVLIIGAWNYPVHLIFGPLIGALAAGNCALLKPSEMTPHCSALLAELVPQYFDPGCVAVVEGGVPETQALLAERWDHIFFTGSSRVGRIVMEAAAKHLTPVTLELGGKSPCIVDKDLDLEVAARRIVWGKFFNAGQTCVAPDYLLVDQKVEGELLSALKHTLKEYYGEDPKQSPDYARIVNSHHHGRLVKLLEKGEVVVGGESDLEQLYIAPTILRALSAEDPVMSEEIFGPILPVLVVQDIYEAIDFVNARPKPLALYLFSNDEITHRKVLERTSSGGVCLNDTMAHLAVPGLPFGGVGESGMGAYHGRHSFETFSHRKGVLDRSTLIDIKLRYPPYRGALKWAKRAMR